MLHATPNLLLCAHHEGNAMDARHDTLPSLLYTLLPQLVQQRVPAIPSLRRTYAGTKQSSRGHYRSSSDESVTPPPSYHTSARQSVCESDDERPSSSGSRGEERERAGVQWKYAKQGYSLLSLSTQEASSLAESPEFSRKLYVDGLEYLLHGLPADLTPEEQLSLRSALPVTLSTPSADEQRAVQIVEAEQDGQRTTAALEPSMLHRSTAAATLYIFLVASLLLPYIQLLLKEAYRYDRKHKISDRMLAQSMIAADTLSRQTVVLASSVCAMNDGKVGEAMRDAALWLVQGVGGGVYEGFGEGMEVLGLRQGATGKVIVDEREETSR